ncbi:hypothetical protein PsYK624_003950 [Phanerochaete sordida]|uniref:Uncharacterized protein n=1 Tax=Phanerochaete sordida TaxID=48140 RepID=A0A9P3FY32_9APHY|nr:hypothetical protein PsYK624_003950 [Phanerochaete sordida]
MPFTKLVRARVSQLVGRDDKAMTASLGTSPSDLLKRKAVVEGDQGAPVGVSQPQPPVQHRCPRTSVTYQTSCFGGTAPWQRARRSPRVLMHQSPPYTPQIPPRQRPRCQS